VVALLIVQAAFHDNQPVMDGVEPACRLIIRSKLSQHFFEFIVCSTERQVVLDLKEQPVLLVCFRLRRCQQVVGGIPQIGGLKIQLYHPGIRDARRCTTRQRANQKGRLDVLLEIGA
jgi:hypothetical protein